MTVYLVRRVLQALLVVLAMSLIVFIGVYAIGDPVEILISPDADQIERERAVQALGLDLPLWQQYTVFLTKALQGDLGRSFVYNEPALKLILQRMPATLELAFGATIIALIIGLPLGLYAGLRPDSRGDTGTLLGLQWSFLTWDGIRHMTMPAINLALFKISLVIRLTRAGVRETMLMDYVKFARAKGLSPARVTFVHVFKNILIPVVTVVGLELGSTIAFSVVTESVFAWPGMGKLIIDSINVLDRPVIVAYLMLIVLMFIAINLIVDLTYSMLDPRVRLESKGT